MQRRGGLDVGVEMKVKVRISGSGTSAGLAKLYQKEAGRGMRAAEDLQGDASIGTLETEGR